MVAEDSTMLERLLREYLEGAGFMNIIECSNGKEAWDIISSFKESERPITDHVACLITDIEMPKMDGHQLTKLIKGDAFLGRLPVIVFSSLIDEAQRAKGNQLGVSAHLSKPQIGKLVSTIDQWIL